VQTFRGCEATAPLKQHPLASLLNHFLPSVAAKPRPH
jgi:hypothetical protein